MLNAEKWKEEINRIGNGIFAVVGGEPKSCAETFCEDCELFNTSNCNIKRTRWLLSDYQESKVDWSKVKVDTPILVSDDGENWERRYFADYYDGQVCAWDGGATSWSAYGIGVVAWAYAKLA